MQARSAEGDGDAHISLPREAIYFHYPHYHHSTPAGAIRAGDWKLIEFFDGGKRELYNLRTDIGENRDLADKHPELVQKLHNQLGECQVSRKAT